MNTNLFYQSKHIYIKNDKESQTYPGRNSIDLAELVQPRKRDGRLRQNYAPTLHQGITKKCIGDSAFGAAATRIWNELPVNIRASGTLSVFRKCLKTYLF